MDKNAKADACAYILTCLLQRLDKSQPGLLEEMIAGVDGDHAAIPEGVPDGEYIRTVFNETLALLGRAHSLNQLA